ncbi:hypothetical protein Fmac_008237 [Flemingia macrophylla]|uniref:Uncharacterized protein n=1 Tax=Flemingia macrophylla TaxID=520843 RepID=A0ABD1MWU1_9FABA
MVHSTSSSAKGSSEADSNVSREGLAEEYSVDDRDIPRLGSQGRRVGILRLDWVAELRVVLQYSSTRHGCRAEGGITLSIGSIGLLRRGWYSNIPRLGMVAEPRMVLGHPLVRVAESKGVLQYPSALYGCRAKGDAGISLGSTGLPREECLHDLSIKAKKNQYKRKLSEEVKDSIQSSARCPIQVYLGSLSRLGRVLELSVLREFSARQGVRANIHAPQAWDPTNFVGYKYDGGFNRYTGVVIKELLVFGGSGCGILRVDIYDERSQSKAKSVFPTSITCPEDVEGLDEALEYDLSGQGIEPVLPFDDFIMSVLRVLNVVRTQLYPNSWAAMQAFKVLCIGLEDLSEAKREGLKVLNLAHQLISPRMLISLPKSSQIAIDFTGRAKPKSIAMPFQGPDPKTLPRPTPQDTLLPITEKKKKDKGKKVTVGSLKRPIKGGCRIDPLAAPKKMMKQTTIPKHTLVFLGGIPNLFIGSGFIHLRVTTQEFMSLEFMSTEARFEVKDMSSAEKLKAFGEMHLLCAALA